MNAHLNRNCLIFSALFTIRAYVSIKKPNTLLQLQKKKKTFNASLVISSYASSDSCKQIQSQKSVWTMHASLRLHCMLTLRFSFVRKENKTKKNLCALVGIIVCRSLSRISILWKSKTENYTSNYNCFCEWALAKKRQM